MSRILPIFSILTWVILLIIASPSLGSDLLKPKSLPLKEKWRCDQILMQALLGRVVFENTDYDVSIVGRSTSRSEFSPRLLKEKTQNAIGDLISQFKNLGLSMKGYIHVLVETSPRVVSPFQNPSPFLVDADFAIKLPGIFETVRKSKMPIKAEPEYNLVLTALDPTMHSLDNLFIVAHELAHGTERQGGHYSKLWGEARADYLAYLVTGQTDLIIPESIDVSVMDSSGRRHGQAGGLIRSLSHPTIKNTSEIMPSSRAAHYNAQIFGSLLYDMTQTMGRKETLSLISWMDHRAKIPPDIYDSKDESEELREIKEEVILANNREIRATRQVILNNVILLGAQMRLWVSQSELNHTQRLEVLNLLSIRGL